MPGRRSTSKSPNTPMVSLLMTALEIRSTAAAMSGSSVGSRKSSRPDAKYCVASVSFRTPRFQSNRAGSEPVIPAV